MVENGYRHLSEYGTSENGQSSISVSEKQRRLILIGAAKQVGPAIFFSLLIILVSFLPVFLARSPRRTNVPALWPGRRPWPWRFPPSSPLRSYPFSCSFYSRASSPRVDQPSFPLDAGALFASAPTLPPVSQNDTVAKPFYSWSLHSLWLRLQQEN